MVWCMFGCCFEWYWLLMSLVVRFDSVDFLLYCLCLDIIYICLRCVKLVCLLIGTLLLWFNFVFVCDNRFCVWVGGVWFRRCGCLVFVCLMKVCVYCWRDCWFMVECWVVCLLIGYCLCNCLVFCFGGFWLC